MSNLPTQNFHQNRQIIVRGAKEHNLKSVDVTLPRDSLIVMTGLSGSGKSSLAFDTIYAEGQRRYVESLSAYARQFLEMMQKPDVERIEGLSPAISIEQKTTSKNPRSTVGTVTEIYDYLRLLFARVGVPYSPTTGKPISSQSISEMVDRILSLKEGTRFYLLAPIVRDRKGEYVKGLVNLQKRGFLRVKIDGQFYEIDETPALDKNIKHTIEIVVDRLVSSKDIGTRLADSFEVALNLSDGLAVAELADNTNDKGEAERIVFSEKFACPVSGFTIEEIEPRLFSFNNPHGACPKCDGLGKKHKVDADMVVPDKTKSLEGGAIAPWSRSSAPYYVQTLNAIVNHYGASTSTAFEDLPKKVANAILFGTGRTKIDFVYDDGLRNYKTTKVFEGVVGNLDRRYKETESSGMREEIEKYMSFAPCSSCNGYRLKPETLAVKIAGLHIGEVSQMSIKEAWQWFLDLPQYLNDTQNKIGQIIIKEIQDRLNFLNDVGLDYLTLSRGSGSLSGGESQRIRLASQIGSGLTGVLYVLDEPSIGLHQRDNARLLETLRRLRDLGNSVIVVEHDEEAILTADYVVDIGPGAGVHGGEIVAQGSPQDILNNENSLTGKYLSGKMKIDIPQHRRKINKERQISLKGATGNNLKNISVDIPLGTFVCITGVSGGGKSTLMVDTLYKAIARRLNGARLTPSPHEELLGLEFIDKVIDIDQSPIGRTPRSNPATYTGAFTPIREWFAGLPEAKTRGYGPGRFSFNVKGGRCQKCSGDGVLKIEMHFLPDVYVECDTCSGKRYNRETLEVTFKGKNIFDILDMSVDDGVEFFSAIPNIREKMRTLQRVGLGYIKIGQPATTLSGGEAQRVKLSKELSKRATGRTLYMLDEPTTGLHFHDVAKLLDVLHELVDNGNTIAVIEHNLDVIKTADWVIDLGPEGGDGGGEIVGFGTPEDIAKIKKSYTGHFLKKALEKRP